MPVIVLYLNASAVFVSLMEFVDFMLVLTRMEDLSTLSLKNRLAELTETKLVTNIVLHTV